MIDRQASLLPDLPDLRPRGPTRAPVVRPVHRSGYARIEQDYYPTPPWVTACLLQHVALRGPVWEPCCGDGAIARVLTDHGHGVVATDLVDRGFGQAGVDFFARQSLPPGCRSILTNPPYGDGGARRTGSNASVFMRKFVRHALDLTIAAQGQLALLVRFQWIAGKRAAEMISGAPLDTVLVLTRRILWFDMGRNTNHAQHHHAWLWFDCQRDPVQPPRIVFADP